MTNNKNKSRDEGSMLPVVAANLIANLFELATDPDLKTKGGEIRGLGRANKVSMALFESAFSSFHRNAFRIESCRQDASDSTRRQHFRCIATIAD